ncbi:PREDICTED: trihelix transcription factor PTL [Tarenaya hassleriana]|uniref:trihelix transcription factor PTL n=1 Tax=Tarenaya hassleriana TaxID=28532 RepID=UPI00053C71F6|nr:PREDICTED: trihelix transcription factor PTL [Tarenaya hassleriana]
MEGHHHHHPHYSIPELRQLMKGGSGGGGGRLESSSPSSHFPVAAAAAMIPSEHFGFNLAPHHPHHRLHQFGDQEMGFVPLGIHGLCTDSSAAAASNASNAATVNTNLANTSGGGGFGGFLDGGDGGGFGGGDGGGSGRWPRQETLTLLEIRSRLDHKFKEANQKGPLWDEVSRIMSEEHGYHRSGKKCREKFENLYKYYKKTKEGKAGRQDGKHYRFFRQLEALYGDPNNSVSLPETQFTGNNALNHNFHPPSSSMNTNPANINNPEAVISSLYPLHQKLSTDNSLSLSNNYNSSELETSSSDDNGNDSTRRKRRGWRAKIKEFVDMQMKRLMERQEAWLEKLTKTIEDKEQQRMVTEEEWRRLEAARIDKEHSFWARERERMEARDVALIEALQCLTGRPLRKAACSSPEERDHGNEIQNHSENQNENGSDQTTTNNVCLKGDVGWTKAEIKKLMEIRTSMESGFQQVTAGGCSDEFLWEEVSAKLSHLGFDQRSALMCKEKWEWINNCTRKENEQLNKKRKENSSNCGVYFPTTEEDPMYNSHGSGYNNNRTTDHDQNRINGDSSPSNSNVGNPDGAIAGNVCFPFFMGDGDQNLWESYGVRLSKGENQ